jgi:hypothetical protein
MPGKPKAIVGDAERRFPLRIVVKVPPGGIGTHYVPMVDWLDEHCGVDGWSITPVGTRGLLNDALAVYVNTPACALAFVERWLVPATIRPVSTSCARMSRQNGRRCRRTSRRHDCAIGVQRT